MDSICIDAICKSVAEYYWEEGYLDAEVSCGRPRPDADTVRISISEGTRSKLRAVSITGASAYDSTRVEAVFGDQIGLPFSRSGLEKGITEVLAFYDARGYPFITVQPDVVSTGDGWVELGLKVDEGQRARLGDVRFTGLSKTKPDVALLESGLVPGEIYDGDKIGQVGPRLLALGVFESVSEPALSFDRADTTISVTFEVVESRASFFEGLVAYAPSAETNKFVGSLNLEMLNIAGTMRRLSVLWSKPGTGRLTWSIDYSEPRIFSKPLDARLRIFSDVIESSFARRRFDVGIAFRGDPRLELGAGAFFGVIKDRSMGVGEGDFSERGVSFDFLYEGRDYALNPRSGLAASVAHEVASLDFEEAESQDRTLTGLEVLVEYAADLGSVVPALRARYHGAFTSRGDVPESHLIRLGGMRTLRGYPEEWFVVEQGLVLTVELRHVLSRNSRIYAFVDGAALDNDAYDFADLDESPLGYGIGFMGGSRSGIFRLEIALNRDAAFGDANLHLGLVQRF
jgi:outer membrane protein assembly factor BamA